jgi:hypothetical protein
MHFSLHTLFCRLQRCRGLLSSAQDAKVSQIDGDSSKRSDTSAVFPQERQPIVPADFDAVAAEIERLEASPVYVEEMHGLVCV